MADFALDPSTHKLVRTMTPSGLRFGLVTGHQATAQRIKIALLHFKGEWFRDESAGTDYKGAIVGKNTELARRAEIRRRCMSVPGVRDVESIDIKIDPKTRRTTIKVACRAQDGELILAGANPATPGV